jgi:hypothetical protein
MGIGSYYLCLGTTELIQAQGLGEGLLCQGLLGEHCGDPIRSFFALGWIEQYELLDLLQLLEQGNTIIRRIDYGVKNI